MATYFTDFSEYSTGSAPPDWTEPYNSQFGWPVEADAGSPGGQRLTVERPNVTAEPHVLTWDDVDSDAERQDAEVLALIEFPSTPDGQLGLVARATGAEDTEEMYNCTVSLGGFNTFRFVNGSFTGLVSGTHSFSAGDLIWVRFRVNGSSIRLRIWQDGNSEPGTWDVDTTDSNVTGDGGVGIYAFSDDLPDAYVHQVGVGTGGDTAPASGSPAPPADPSISWSGEVWTVGDEDDPEADEDDEGDPEAREEPERARRLAGVAR